METTDIIDRDYGTSEQTAVIPAARASLGATANWAKFIGIMGLIGSLLFALLGIFGSLLLESMVSNRFPFPSGLITVFALVLAGFYMIPSIFILQFGFGASRAVQASSTTSFTQSLKQLKLFIIFSTITMGMLMGLQAMGLLGNLL